MASVLFSTIGQAIGGPLGAGIGAAIGTGVDASLFRSRQAGAQDGFASRSAYGETVPHVFGRTRVGGLLIWATAPHANGEKGQGRRARTTNFAMALSRGPVSEVGRIWADGAILRNAEGSFLTPVRMRLHSTGQVQPDPLIAAAEGMDRSPAYSALSYVVFEDFDLGPFGNRIPSLSFEVEADQSSSAVDWLGQLAALADARLVTGPASEPVDGYTAWFDPFVEDVSALLGASGAHVGQLDGQLSLIRQARLVELASTDLLGDPQERESDSLIASSEHPASYGLSYHDSSRDYQLGWQQDERSRRGRSLSASWPLAAEGATARTIAGRLLRTAAALPPRFLPLAVGDCVRFPSGDSWLVTRREIRGLSLWIEGRKMPDDISLSPGATDSGRALPSTSVVVPPSVCAVIEPPVPVYRGMGPALLVIGTGSRGWRGAEVRLVRGGDELSVGRLEAQQPFGVLAEDLAFAPDTVWDERNAILVDIGNGADGFLSRTAKDVLEGAGLVRVGEELLQFRRADVVGAGMVRLSGLLRGRFGTGTSGAAVPAGALVIAVPPGGGGQVDLTAESVGAEVTLLVSGSGDALGGSELRHLVEGSGFSPFAPVHVKGRRLADGTIVCSWVPRGRGAWSWSAASEPEAGSLIWHFSGDGGEAWSVSAMSTGIRFSLAEQANLFGAALPLGGFRVEARGDGPVRLRSTSLVRI
jgi:hypothetical protein